MQRLFCSEDIVHFVVLFRELNSWYLCLPREFEAFNQFTDRKMTFSDITNSQQSGNVSAGAIRSDSGDCAVVLEKCTKERAAELKGCYSQGHRRRGVKSKQAFFS